MFDQKYENLFQECLSAMKKSTNDSVSICVHLENFEKSLEMRKAIYYTIFKLNNWGYKFTFAKNTITLSKH